ncbi:MAG TPA: alpha/beta hydrolase [Kiritimatiellia bacterium]|nr:alpha/beta hydrolase [Kiritimatiellia bacterium]
MQSTRVCLRLLPLALALASVTPAMARGEEATSATSPYLERAFEQYPDADENEDGILTETEAIRYRKMLRKFSETMDVSETEMKPDLENVSYGPHPRNIMDFWKAKSDTPTPLVIYIHGGGFVGGDKKAVRSMRLLEKMLGAGVSVASINYRFLNQANINLILRDGARAVQFARLNAAKHNIDPKRIALAGTSAGSGMAMWTAFHDELADPSSFDPVLRRSSRVRCVAAINPQASYDMRVWDRIMGAPPVGKPMGNAFYGINLDAGDTQDMLERAMKDASMLDQISRGDPPLFLSCRYLNTTPKSNAHYKHHPKQSIALKERCDEVGIECITALRSDGVSSRAADNRLIMFLLSHLDVAIPDEFKTLMEDGAERP